MAQESVLRVGVDSAPAVAGSAKGKEALKDLGAQAIRTEGDFDKLAASMKGNTNQIVSALTGLGSRAKTTQGQIRDLTEAVRQGTWSNGAGFNQLTAAIDRMGDEARQTNQQLLAMKNAAGSASTGMGGLRNVLLGVGVFEVARRFMAITDAATNMDNRLRLVTKTSGEMAGVYEKLLANSNAVGVQVQDSVQLYSRLAISTRELGLSYSGVIDLTNRLNQAMIISGGSTTEGAAALRQLGQALGKDSLNGDELTSILENAPKVAQVIADSMNVPVGALKDMGAQGKLTARDIVQAFKEAGPQLDEEMAKVAPTIERSLNVVKNRVLDFVKELNENGLGKGIATAILFIANNFDILATATIGVGAALIGSLIPGMYAASAAFLATPIGWFTVGLAAAGAALAIFGRQNITIAGQTATGWEWIKSAVLTVWEGAIRPALTAFGGMFSWLKEKVFGFAGDNADAFSAILAVVKAGINIYIGNFAFAFLSIKNAWSNLPGMLNAFFVGAVNLGITAVERLVNSWRDGLSLIASLTKTAAPGISMGISAILGATGPLKLDRMQNSAAGAAFNAGQASARDTAYGTDYVGNAVGAIANNVSRVQRPSGDPNLDGSYGGSGNTAPDGGDKDGSGRNRETAAQMLERFTREQNNAIDVSRRYYTVSAAQADLDKMNEEYHKRFGQFIAPTEAAALLDLAQKKADEADMQRTRDGILRDAIEPQREYARGVAAVSELTAKNAITTEESAIALRNVRIAFLESKRDMASGLELGFLKIEDDFENKARRAASAMSSIFNDVRGPALDYEAHMAAVNDLHDRGAISAEQYAEKVRDIRIAYLDTQTDFASGWSRAILKVQKDTGDASRAIEDAITGAFKNAEDALLDFLDTGKLDLHSFFDDMWKDLARGQIREQVLNPIANWLGNKMGVNVPGLSGGELGTAGNPMHVVMGGDTSPAGIFDALTNRTADAANDNDQMTTNWFTKVRDGFGSLWERVQGGIENSKSWFGTLFSNIGNWISNLGSGGGGAGSIFSTILSVGSSLFGGGGGAGFGGTPIPSDLVGLFKEGGYSNSPVSMGRMPHYAEGTPNTSGGIPAMLHDNEAVVPLSRGRSIPVELKGGGQGQGDVYINIDARGAETGVEAAVRRVMAEEVPGILQTARSQSREDLKSLARQKI